MQLVAGLALGPPLLLLLHRTPVPTSLRELLHGMQYLFARSHSVSATASPSPPLLLASSPPPPMRAPLRLRGPNSSAELFTQPLQPTPPYPLPAATIGSAAPQLLHRLDHRRRGRPPLPAQGVPPPAISPAISPAI